MKRSVGVFLFVAAAVCSSARDRRPAPSPEQFEVGRQTFFDFGPPTDYYDIFLVRQTQNGSSVTKISVTPPAGACLNPTVTSNTGMLHQSVAELLQPNPCALREKDLRRKPKRCKKCLVFSGAIVNLNIHCGESERLIHSDILDRDWFAEKPDTPNRTRWSMHLLDKLDAATSPSPLDRPVFQTGSTQLESSLDGQTERDLLAGKFDHLFPGSSENVSQLYRDSLRPQIRPEVTVVSVSSTPTFLTPPAYPPIARVAQVEGNVEVQFHVDDSGMVVDPMEVKGHPLLRGSAEQVVRTWRFLPGGGRRQMKTVIAYQLNCPPRVH